MVGRIVKVSGPLIVAENMADVKVYDVVKVGDDELIGEVIELSPSGAAVRARVHSLGKIVPSSASSGANSGSDK